MAPMADDVRQDEDDSKEEREGIACQQPLRMQSPP